MLGPYHELSWRAWENICKIPMYCHFYDHASVAIGEVYFGKIDVLFQWHLLHESQ
jgi:hypothetical protein